MYYVAAFSPLKNASDIPFARLAAALAGYWLLLVLGCMLVDSCRTALFRLLRLDRLIDRCGEWVFRALRAGADRLFTLTQRIESK